MVQKGKFYLSIVKMVQFSSAKLGDEVLGVWIRVGLDEILVELLFNDVFEREFFD